MKRSDFSNIITNPSLLKNSDVSHLNSIITEFPYFQSARILYLKGLKNTESFKYNKNLKITAAYTTDRSVLFDFITSEFFIQNNISELIKKTCDSLKDININEFLDIPESTKSQVNNKIENDVEEIILDIGKPFEFKKDESYSFNQWLQLTKIKPINRAKSKNTPSQKQEKNIKLINDFIEKSPKINPTESSEHLVDLSKKSSLELESLMTETLARVYLEQKNYDKAIRSYKILSLKYPEKSALFADQIKAIKKLQ
tara:strand:+ start:995 stop:1762 length:768 start_codon:yes stop_codon:yes gene_type:complete